MTFSPISAIHTVSLLGFLALGPGGCDDHDSLSVADTPISGPETPTAPPTTTPPAPPPSGGTPEPGTMLLLAGGAVGYATLRRRRKNGTEEAEQSEV